jgi:hypothetical protein
MKLARTLLAVLVLTLAIGCQATDLSGPDVDVREQPTVEVPD